MIGLLDYDILTSASSSRIIPNLEIMKLATYYKVEENQFCKLLNLEEDNLNNFERIYFFSETVSNPSIPESFLKAQNVTYGGAGFTKKYQPFENIIIDYTLPRASIYKDFLKEQYNNGAKFDTISHVLDDAYYRIYAGDNKLPIPPMRSNKRIYLYDTNIFYDNWLDILKEIQMRKPSNIICIHPIVCTNLTNFFTLRNLEGFARDNEYILNLDIPIEQVRYMLYKYKMYFLETVTKTSKIYLTLGGSYPTKELYYKDLIYKLNLLYSFWSYGIMIKIKVINADFGYYNPITHLEKAIELFANFHTEKKLNKTLLQMIPKKKKNNFVQEEYDALILSHPSAKNLFEQSFNALKDQGVWRI